MTYSVLKEYLFPIILIIILTCPKFVQSQDTILTNIYTLDEPVSNIDGLGSKIIIRTPSILYRLGDDNEFEKIRDLDPSKDQKYTWIASVEPRGNFKTYNTDYIIPSRIAQYGIIGAFLPGYHHDNITIAKDGKVIYTTFRGSILRYEVRGLYKIKNRWETVNNVYVDDSIKITSTYSAIYKDTAYNIFGLDTIKGVDPTIGIVNKINGKYYLCSDKLYRLEKNYWTQIKFTTDAQHHFIKLAVNKNETYFLSSECFGIINLEKSQIIDTLLTNSKESEFFDMKWIKDRSYLSNSDGTLHIYEKGKSFKKVLIGSPIYDINFSINQQEAFLSTKSGIYKLNLSDLKVTFLYPLFETFQTMFVDSKLIATTSHGLFMEHNNKLREIVPRTEFNKYGLTVFQGLIYAGSVEGLFVIDKSLLLKDLTNSFKVIEFSDRKIKNIWLISFLVFLLLVLIIVLIVQDRKSKQKIVSSTKKAIVINPDNIRKIVTEQPQLISVELIADYFETSTVQLNRILKRYNTSGLVLLKSIKLDIVKEMIAQEKSLEEISKRVGYSINYIKRNLL